MARHTQRAFSKTTRTWVFWYATERSGDKIVIGTKDCKEPERTNLRKEQSKYWNKNEVVEMGYTIELNDPMLVWPHSNLK